MIKINMKHTKAFYLLLVVLAVFIFNNCNTPDLTFDIKSTVNPFKIAPLSAVIHIKTNKPCQGIIKVLGKSPVEYPFKMKKNTLNVPLLGLYPGRVNDVLINMECEGENVSKTIQIETEKIPDFFPDITIDKMNREKMEAGFHACDMHFANHGTFKSLPFIFDDEGLIRWYLDLSAAGDMVAPFQRLKNGTILATSKRMFVEYDMLGKPLRQNKLDPQFKNHHDVIELPDGNLLALVSKEQVPIELGGKLFASTNDFIILYDLKNSKVLKEWDLAKHLDVSRDVINVNKKFDWLHSNGLAFNPKDKSIIISGKNQGLFKISWDDKLQWILSPKKGWGKAGRFAKSFETTPYLLTAVDKNGQPYNNAIQMGTESAADFDFSWGQHAPKLMPNGNLLAFDNGVLRNFKTDQLYSRAVEYKIDKKNKTVSQVWQYGKERGNEFFSSVVSDVDYLPDTKNILITAGNIRKEQGYATKKTIGDKIAKIVEVEYPSGEEVFEATIELKTMNGKKIVAWGQSDVIYRSERVKLSL